MHIVSCMLTKFYEVPCSSLRGVTLTTTTKNRTDGPVKKIIPLASSLREVSLMFLKDFKNRMRMMIKKKRKKRYLSFQLN